MAKTEKWLTVEQIASHLQVSKETIYRWLDKDRVPAHKVGKQWRFLASEVDEWVRAGDAEFQTQSKETRTQEITNQ